ncbi:MAG: MotA/TolQ/ExbB proton channel family protein [Planctomycetota bacterium]|nr:MotA/TolQ/ExbB proton channel family protein [Planctomycetota bacterium]
MSGIMELTTSFIAQAAPGAEGATDEMAPVVLSVWELALKGGPMMIPIGIASLIALAIAAERLLTLRRSSVIPPALVERMRALLAKHPVDAKEGVAACEKCGSALGRVLAAGFRRLHEPTDLLEKHIEEAGEREAVRLRKNLRGLSVIASIAPLMGLLGTIFGMISAFQTVSLSGDALGRTELLAGGIYEAMITTAAGLLVAIPALIVYHWLTARVERLIFDIDAITVDLIEGRPQPTRETATAARLATSNHEFERIGDDRPAMAPAAAGGQAS